MPGKNGEQRVGKLPSSLLAPIIKSLRRSPAPSTLLGPAIGEDAGVVDTAGCLLVSHVDPITEAGEYAGLLAVLVAANDLAVSGAIPRWAQVLLLLPPSTGVEEAEKILEGAAKAAERLGIDIIGGHTENSPGITKPVIAVFAMGCACKECLTPTRNARPGDLVVQIGWAGAEGTAILASDFSSLLESKGVSRDIIEEARRLAEDISVLEQAVELARRGFANALHDATEGGLVGALVEMATASGTQVEIDASRVPIHPATTRIAEKLGVDPLRLISSGVVIAAVPSSRAEPVLEIAKSMGRPAAVIGRILHGDPLARIIYPGGVREYREPPEDEISRFWL